MLFCCFLCVLQFYGINHESHNSARKAPVRWSTFGTSENTGKIKKWSFTKKSLGEPEGLLEGH